ncbi:MAG: metallopeptidase family protein [Lachnospiraceae bacterium]|jgi:predicted Zn-dependent protease with MMP-like domain|nr:metallopeptidase family protein [Lachnospiraceae bacterium]
MISFEAFEQMVADITETLPEEFFRELSGGVMVKEERKLHPQSVGAELNIMGEYRRHPHLGRFVVIYYGSFAAVYGYEGPEELRERVRKTILHEFRHHLESLAGERGLEVEDAIRLADYRKRRQEKQE